jgi:HlyD family secretion protein
MNRTLIAGHWLDKPFDQFHIPTIQQPQRLSGNCLTGELTRDPTITTRSSVARWMLLAGLPLVLSGIAWIPIHHQITAPAVLTRTAPLKTVTGGMEGVLQQVFVQAGDHVTKGQRLFRVIKPLTKSTTSAQNELLLLTAREARLQTLLAQLDPGNKVVTTSTEQTVFSGGTGSTGHQSLTAKLQAGLETLVPLQQRLRQAAEKLTTTEASRQATQSQLAATRQRMAKIQILQKQGVVYDEGIYIEPLYTTLQAETETLQGELKNRNAAVETAQQHLLDARNRLFETQAQVRQQLQGKLFDTRASIKRIQAKLEADTSQADVLDIHAPDDGIIEHLNDLSPGKTIKPQDVLLVLQNRTDLAMVTFRLSPGEELLIQPGQPLKATFADVKRGTRMAFLGRVKSLTYPMHPPTETQPRCKVQAEINIPATSPGPGFGLSSGAVGEVNIEVEAQPLWRYLTRRYQPSFP